MSQPLYQVDAFASKVFEGNPAAVCPLSAWLPDRLMQRMAQENNLSETAFFVPSTRDGYDFDLRWFTPTEEVDLCGHATLASAFVAFNILHFTNDIIRFHSASGLLNVTRNGNLLTLDFPAWPLEKTGHHPAIEAAIGITPLEIYQSHDWLVILDSAQAVRNLKLDFAALKLLDARGLIVTAPADTGSGFDFVSRAFFPKLGIEEDPVTGSAHCALTPYWAGILRKPTLKAEQGGARKGQLTCELAANGRILISGQAQLYMEGACYLPGSAA
ncbi:MAG: PhzF family phenazine biosynthesis protein [Alphaproteobacteria bacterium]|nr:PhzF family phenazine biosynthesis protein [Alphaproteobacteria bacterium]